LRYGLCYVPEVFSVVRLSDTSLHVGRPSETMRAAMRSLASLIQSKEFADILPYFKACAPAHLFGSKLLAVALKKQNRSLLNLLLIKRGVSMAAREFVTQSLDTVKLRGVARKAWHRSTRYRTTNGAPNAGLETIPDSRRTSSEI